MLQTRDVTRPKIALSVDEDRRCTVDPVRDSTLHVSFDAVRECASVEGGTQGNGIDAGRGCSAVEPCAIELVLMCEQPVVHDPERVGTGQRVHRLGGFRGLLRVGMDLPQWEIAEYRAEGVRVPAPQAGKHQLECARVRTLVVAVDDHRGWCRGSAANVVALDYVEHAELNEGFRA